MLFEESRIDGGSSRLIGPASKSTAATDAPVATWQRSSQQGKRRSHCGDCANSIRRTGAVSEVAAIHHATEAAWRRNRCGEAQPVVAGRPRGGGAQDRAKGNLVKCRAKGLGEAQDLESDACGRRAERLDKHRVVLLAALGKAKKRLEAQPLVGRAGGGLVGAAHLVDANRTGRVGGAEECEQQLGSAVALSPQVLKESQRLDG